MAWPRQFLATAALAFSVVGSPVDGASAQATRPDAVREYHGMNAGIVSGVAQWRLDEGEHATQFLGGFHVGYRLSNRRIWDSRVSLTPHVVVVLTRFGGVRLGSDQVGYARLGPGLQLAARVGRYRPYLVGEFGSSAVERQVGGVLVNAYGSTSTVGVGVELPRRNACSSGFDVAIRTSSGTLDESESRGPSSAPSRPKLRALALTVGWSGEFRGTRGLSCR